jgi:hypothetical protein
MGVVLRDVHERVSDGVVSQVAQLDRGLDRSISPLGQCDGAFKAGRELGTHGEPRTRLHLRPTMRRGSCHRFGGPVAATTEPILPEPHVRNDFRNRMFDAGEATFASASMSPSSARSGWM